MKFTTRETATTTSPFYKGLTKKKKKRLGNQAELVKPDTEWLGSENISESKKTKQKKSKEKSHSRIPTN